MGILDEVVADLTAEGDELDAFLQTIDAEGWRRPTPSPGWAVADQVAHLAWTDSVAIVALTDPEAFKAVKIEDPRAAAVLAPAELMDRWSAARRRVIREIFAFPAGTKIPWFGPPMSPTSMATARLMETWAHGADIRGAFGVAVSDSSRLRHVAHIGVITRNFAYATNQLEPPTADIFVSLDAPDGSTWTWGPDAATQSIRGSALEFCLVVTRRRHPDDVALKIEGPDARQWMQIAQAFAGPPGPPPDRL